MAGKKKSIYEGVSYDELKEELQDSILYLQSEPIEELEDRIEWKATKTGGIMPSVIAVIEEQIDLQIGVIEKCSRMLKSIYEQENLSEFVQSNIDVMINKLAEVQKYYRIRPITKTEDRFVLEEVNDKKSKTGSKTIRFLSNKRENIIKMRTTTTEKILRLQPLIKELESFKETVILKGGYEIPESMLYD